MTLGFLHLGVKRWMDYNDQDRGGIKGLLGKDFSKNLLVYVMLLSGLR